MSDFEKWWKKHAYYDDVGTAPKFCAGEAWNHQQQRIEQLEGENEKLKEHIAEMRRGL